MHINGTQNTFLLFYCIAHIINFWGDQRKKINYMYGAMRKTFFSPPNWFTFINISCTFSAHVQYKSLLLSAMSSQQPRTSQNIFQYCTAHPNQQDFSQMWQMGMGLSYALKTFIEKKKTRTGETYPNALTQEKINMRRIHLSRKGHLLMEVSCRTVLCMAQSEKSKSLHSAVSHKVKENYKIFISNM